MNVNYFLGKWQSALTYRDDIVVFLNTVEQHLTHLRRVPTLLPNAVVAIKLKRSSFVVEAINYLCHIIYLRRLEIAETTTKAIQERQDPTSKTEVWSCLGFYKPFRQYVSSDLRTATPLNKILHKNHRKAFSELITHKMGALHNFIQILITSLVPSLLRATGHYTVATDACSILIRCELLQQQTDIYDRPIVYCSRLLNNIEKILETAHKECLAVVWAVLLLKTYLEGSLVTIKTHQEAFKWLLTILDTSWKLTRLR